MGSPGIPWQQILGIAGNAATNSANAINGQPSGIPVTQGLTTGLPIPARTNPNAQGPNQMGQNVAQAVDGAQALRNRILANRMAQQGGAGAGTQGMAANAMGQNIPLTAQTPPPPPQVPQSTPAVVPNTLPNVPMASTQTQPFAQGGVVGRVEVACHRQRVGLVGHA